jgi:hypothetical protein
MSAVSMKVVFEDGNVDVLSWLPGAPGDKEYSSSFRGYGFSGHTRRGPARADAIRVLEERIGQCVATFDGEPASRYR